MPIRTHRGRAAVYRRLWGWPLRSPRHLAVAVLALAVLAGGISAVLPKSAIPQYRQANPTPLTRVVVPTTAPTSSVSEAGIPFTATSSPQAAPVPAAPSPDALKVITAWGKAWVHHPAGITAAAWLDGLRPYSTDEAITVMSKVDPANVPGSSITGNPTAVISTISSVQATLPTDGGPLKVLAITTGNGWRVAWYTKG